MSEGSETGGAIQGWWATHLGNRDTPQTRQVSAWLRRASGSVELLSHPAVHALSADLRATTGVQLATDPVRLSRLARVLAEVRENESGKLAHKLGEGDPPAMSVLRFRRMLSAEDSPVGSDSVESDALTAALRRAVIMAGRRCDVASLGRDLFYWTEKVRISWTFHYYGAAAPSDQETVE